MTESPSLVPADELTAQLPNIGEKYFIPEALALCRSLQGRRAADLSEDEILMLALTAAQAALAKHVSQQTSLVSRPEKGPGVKHLEKDPCTAARSGPAQSHVELASHTPPL
jgi:hypothetical protein